MAPCLCVCPVSSSRFEVALLLPWSAPGPPHPTPIIVPFMCLGSLHWQSDTQGGVVCACLWGHPHVPSADGVSLVSAGSGCSGSLGFSVKRPAPEPALNSWLWHGGVPGRQAKVHLSFPSELVENKQWEETCEVHSRSDLRSAVGYP